MATGKQPGYPRRLRVFSLDPAADIELDTALISRCVLHIDWEDLQPGPIGDYVEVIDYDPASGCCYEPVFLDEKLATDGLSPSTGNPQFHQQMVYAVTMYTIKNFERILGRRVTWAERSKDENGRYIAWLRDRFVPRLRIYPHALRQQNAYYSPSKRALLFGYFNAPTTDPREELPGGLVFTCLSHDIIAHETAHAILDGIHPRLLEASNADMLAFHEAFADIVAIFQHFTLPGLLLDQIQKTRGELARNNLLAKLASQFARSTGRGGALRNALGTMDENGNRQSPDPTEFGRTTAPHQRGAILVAAVFDAFLRIYEHRVADLRRIASEGTGILREGDIHPDLANRFAGEAVKAASRVLTICVRAIDYLPPVDITFGDYLRALITADADSVPDDPHRYRLAFIESFRERGIYPLDVRTLSEESLRWSAPESDDVRAAIENILPPPHILSNAIAYEASNLSLDERSVNKVYSEILHGKSAILNALDRGQFTEGAEEVMKIMRAANDLPASDQPGGSGNLNRFLQNKMFCVITHMWISRKAKLLGEKEKKVIEGNLGLDIDYLIRDGGLYVHAVLPILRNRPDGRTKTELVVVMTQGVRKNLLDEQGNEMADAHDDSLSYKFRGGCTLIIDPENGRVEYAISKRAMSQRRQARQANFLREQYEENEQDAVARFALTTRAAAERDKSEPLGFVHSHHEDEGVY